MDLDRDLSEVDVDLDIDPPDVPNFDAPPPPEPERGFDPPPVSLRRVLRYLLGAATLISLERAAMLVFVLPDPHPALLVAAGATFFACVATVFVVGVSVFARHRRA